MDDADKKLLREVADAAKKSADSSEKAAANSSMAVEQVRSFGRELSEFERKSEARFVALEGRVGKVEDESSGLHSSPDLSASLVEDPSIPPPPKAPRERMNTGASIRAIQLETAKQTPLIESALKEAEEAKKTALQNNQVRREGNARLVGLAVATAVIYLLQNCHSLPFGQAAPSPSPAPAPAVTAAPLPAPR